MICLNLKKNTIEFVGLQFTERLRRFGNISVLGGRRGRERKPTGCVAMVMTLTSDLVKPPPPPAARTLDSSFAYCSHNLKMYKEAN